MQYAKLGKDDTHERPKKSTSTVSPHTCWSWYTRNLMRKRQGLLLAVVEMKEDRVSLRVVAVVGGVALLNYIHKTCWQVAKPLAGNVLKAEIRFFASEHALATTQTSSLMHQLLLLFSSLGTSQCSGIGLILFIMALIY